MANAEDARRSSLLGSPMPAQSSSRERVVAPAHGKIKSTKLTCNCRYSCKNVSRIGTWRWVSPDHLLDLGLHLGRIDGSTAPGSHDPGSSEEGHETRRRLDKVTSANDENARSAALLRFICEQRHACVSAWLEKKPSLRPICRKESTAKQEPHQLNSHFETRARCQEFVARYEDDGLSLSVNSPFFTTKSTILVRQSRSPEYRVIGRWFAQLWEVLAAKLPKFFPTSGFRAQVSNIFDRRYGIPVPVPKFAPVGRLVCVRLIFLTTFCNKLLVKQTRWRLLLASSLVCYVAGRGLFSFAVLFFMATTVSHLHLQT